MSCELLYYLQAANNKGPDQTADLRLCCLHIAYTGFLMTKRLYLPKICLRPKKNICVFQVSQPYLGFWPDPKHFIFYCVKKKKKIYIYISKEKKKRCGHKTCGSILALRDRFFFGI